MQVIERTEGHYEVQEVQFGTVYRWCPECVVVQCGCGERPNLTPSQSICPECAVEHGPVVREGLAARQLEDELAHPWRYAEDRQDVGLPC